MQRNIIKKESGYTLIETMIAVALFIIIVTTGLGALLNANALQKKSQNMRSILDNLNFIMEDMSRNLRTGYSFHCIDDGALTTFTPHSCTNGGGISFKSSLGGQWVYYINTSGRIFKSVDGASSFVQLTPDEIFIKPISNFSVVGAEANDKLQPFVTIKLIGEINYPVGTITPFSLQTSVSQRLMDI